MVQGSSPEEDRDSPEDYRGVAEKLVGRLTMTGVMELQPDDGPRLSLSIGAGFERCSGISPKFARRFAEGIGKLTGNTSGDHRKKIGRLAARMSEAIGLAVVRFWFGLHPKKIGSGHRCASRRRTQEWT
ncbi:hypothetical protein GW17_00054067 [Ensete ventricosum]|nr:hypothetical protein GW17_00054067 [Ensete ventricosum]